MTVLLVALGGGAGASGRYLLARYVPAYKGFPAATFAANVIGCFLLGLFTGAALSTEMAALLATGFCGGLTTFSTFSVEIATLLQQGRVAWALGAVGMHVVGSVVMTFAGIGTVYLFRRIFVS